MARHRLYSALHLAAQAALAMARDRVTMTFARKKKVITYSCAGQNISGTIYYPKSDSKAPAVLLLPTAAGLTPHEHAMAARLAREGYTTLALAYTKRTTGAVAKDKRTRWPLEQVVVRGWLALQEDQMADRNRAAVIGLSLGGYFATYLASVVKECAPKAIVIYYGVYVLAESQVAPLGAPLLVLQGEDDDPDFVMNAKKLKERSFGSEKICEVVLYPGIGHQFDLFESGSPAALDAWQRMVRFLGDHLRP